MDPGLSPKPKGVAAKKSLFVVLGIAIAVWYIAHQNTQPGPRVAPHSSISNDMSAGPGSPTVAPTPVSTTAKERVERYPLLQSPDEVQPDKEFKIRVSLTEQQYSDVTIVSGPSTHEGKVVLNLPAQQDNWKLDVYLNGDGLDFTQGINSSSIDLPRHGDPIPATFLVKADPQAAADGMIHVMATFEYKGTPLARVQRDIKITGATPAVASEAPPAPTPKASLTPASIEISDEIPRPNLMVDVWGDQVEVTSPWLTQPFHGTLPDLKGFSDFLAQRSPARAGRGFGLVAPERVRESAADSASDFGGQLYDHYAPDVFKSVFWELVNKHGKSFHTIQIYSDKPDIPWELMRPARQDGTDRQDFLGLDYSVARWNNDDRRMVPHPPYHESMPKMFVIAPRYSGSQSLKGEAEEIRDLAQLDGYSAVDGNENAVKALLHNPPQGIVHFAGHGTLDAVDNKFEILLEDGALDVQAWRSMAESASLSHTFFFFNACDVGQANHVGNFADGFGPALLGQGASGYIGALWPVNDEIAASFSVRFYQLLQQQLQVGPADVSATLARTRREIYEKTKNPTALAYVIYGDTNLQFVKQ